MATNIMHLPRDFRDAFLGLLHFRFFSYKENYDAFQASFVIFACTSMKDDEIISRIALQLEDFKVRNHCFRHNRKAVGSRRKSWDFSCPTSFSWQSIAALRTSICRRGQYL